MLLSRSELRASASLDARKLLAQTLREELASRGALVMEALGSSMEPTVPGGSFLRIEPLRGAPPVDELIAFVPPRGVLVCCHRVVALEHEGCVRTQGDRRTTPDDWIPCDQIVGVVRCFKLGGQTYKLSPGSKRPRPSSYRAQCQRLERLWRRLRAK
jgi:hypothetical protein